MGEKGMCYLGKIKLADYLEKYNGVVTGRVVTDGKNRYYRNEYDYKINYDEKTVNLKLKNEIKLPSEIKLTSSLIAFLGVYSGDGAKGIETNEEGRIHLADISFAQREPNLVKFAVTELRYLFSENIIFNFSLGEDSAYFLDGKGKELLEKEYGGRLPVIPSLDDVLRLSKKKLSEADKEYLNEQRNGRLSNKEYLSFWYYCKESMERILTNTKIEELSSSGVMLNCNDKVTSSVRRPFKKGAREEGKSSRSDELTIKGLSGLGELFLKIIHETEESIYNDHHISSAGLIEWNDIPSKIGERLDIEDFFLNNEYGKINNTRPSFSKEGIDLYGKWGGNSKKIRINQHITLDPLFCYVSGLYLAEGSTSKSKLFKMFNTKIDSFSMGFTSTENVSIELLLRTLNKLFKKEDCLQTWKIKVGSQYFSELVIVGLKNGVPMLRGGSKGQGKLKTMEISLAIKPWALNIAPCLNEYADKFSHIEPTGSGIARIDFSASSTLCRWFFPLLMYAVFGKMYKKPIWR